MKARSLLAVPLLLAAAACGEREAPPPPDVSLPAPPSEITRRGAFGLICRWNDNGELYGIRLTVKGETPDVTFTFCEGRCAEYRISNVKTYEDQIEFDGVPQVPGQANIPLHFVGRFTYEGAVIEGRAETTAMRPVILKHPERSMCRDGSAPADPQPGG